MIIPWCFHILIWYIVITKILIRVALSLFNKKKATPHYKSLPSESVEDNRVVTVNGIWVVWWQANIAQLHLIARDPMVHHSKARIKWRPPWKTQMVNYRKAVYLQLNSLHLVSGSFFLQRLISKIALKSFFFFLFVLILNLPIVFQRSYYTFIFDKKWVIQSAFGC